MTMDSEEKHTLVRVGERRPAAHSVLDWTEFCGHFDAEVTSCVGNSRASSYPVNVLVLASWSRLLYDILKDVDPCLAPSVVLDHVDSRTTEALVELIFSGCAKTTESIVPLLIDVCKSIGIDAQRFRVSTSNAVVGGYTAAAPSSDSVAADAASLPFTNRKSLGVFDAVNVANAVSTQSTVVENLLLADNVKHEFVGVDVEEVQSPAATNETMDDHFDSSPSTKTESQAAIVSSNSPKVKIKVMKSKFMLGAKLEKSAKKENVVSGDQKAVKLSVNGKIRKRIRGLKGVSTRCHVCGETFTNGLDFYRHFKKHKCPYCDLTFTDPSLRKQHCQEMHFRCDICQKTFLKMQRMVRHRRTHFLAQCEFKCRRCGIGFVSERERQIHVESVHGGRMLKCEFCDNIYQEKSELAKHVRKHVPELQFHCELCDRRFPYRTSYKYHMEKHTKAIDMVNLFCNDCRQSFQSLCGLTKHKCTVPRETFPCSECKREFNTKQSLNLHFRLHTGRSFECKECKKTFAGKQTYTMHMSRVHTNERPFVCDICHKSYKTRDDVNLHMRTHNSVKNLHCASCDYKTNYPRDLRNHMMIHNGEKPLQCEVCAKRFRMAGQLQIHMRFHTGEKPFSCTFCQKSFAYKPHLKDHLRIHTGEKPFSCQLCQRKCRTSDLLYHHMQTHQRREAQGRETRDLESQPGAEVDDNIRAPLKSIDSLGLWSSKVEVVYSALPDDNSLGQSG